MYRDMNFLGPDKEHTDFTTSKVIVLPVPYEATVSYGSGTAEGPAAIIEASAQVELYDEELDAEPFKVGVHTRPELPVRGISPEKMLGILEKEVKAVIEAEKVPLIFGGEHSITVGAIRPIIKKYPDLCVLQFDAHADLRPEYQGNIYSHACAMARVRELCPAVQVGIRSLSKEEADLIKKKNYPVFYAHSIFDDDKWVEKVIKSIPTKKVFITFDVDAFSSSLMPTTGTPEPGGLEWYHVTRLLMALSKKVEVVGMDIVELAPMKGFHSTDFLVAKLAHKAIGYFWSK